MTTVLPALGRSARAPIPLAAAALALAGCSPPPPSGWAGYVEGEFVQVAAAQGGLLARLDVQAGQTVAAGAPLFALDGTAEAAGADEARARLAAAQAQARNTGSGRRADEIAVTRAQLAQAQAQAALARSELARRQQLLAQRFVAPASVDDARNALAQAEARVAELEAALRVAALPARPDERRAAAAQAEAAAATLAASRWRAALTTRSAPADAEVADTYLRVGEWVAAGQPVLALLPRGAVKARFFVPEAEIATLRTGLPVRLACDGCGAPIEARISFIAAQAEYTPPVLYTNTQRARRVFRVEARPAPADAGRLRPGLPLDVTRVAPAGASGAGA
jgi:HlyD family secretion protein